VVRIYLRVADLEAATRAAVQSGAKVLLESMDLPGRGRITIFELGGVQHGLWQVD
jgi:predicted enzyme related to lactoylglutathione lyase